MFYSNTLKLSFFFFFLGGGGGVGGGVGDNFSIFNAEIKSLYIAWSSFQCLVNPITPNVQKNLSHDQFRVLIRHGFCLVAAVLLTVSFGLFRCGPTAEKFNFLFRSDKSGLPSYMRKIALI